MSYEIQVRRPCTQPNPRLWVGKWECPECGAYVDAEFISGAMRGTINHRPVTEWMPLADAIRQAHVEEAKAAQRAMGIDGGKA